MKVWNKIALIIWGIAIPVLLDLPQCFGQKSTKIDSLRLENGTKGHAMFEYITKAGNEVKAGDFEFYQSQIDSTNEDYAIGLSYEGSYRNNNKTGNWTYSYSRLKPSVLKRLDKTNIIYAGTGTRFGLYGQFQQNKATGEWYAVNQTIDYGEVVDTLFFAKTAFDQDQMMGKFESKGDSLAIIGNIDEEGFLNGTWVFYQISKELGKIEEHRIYEKGVLVRHFFKINEDEYAIKHIGLDQTPGGEGENWKEVNVSRAYFNIIYQTNFGTKSDEFTSKKTNDLIKKSNRFLKHSIFAFGSHNDKDLWKVTDSNSIVYPKLLVRAFPYTKEEKENIEEANRLIKESISEINSFLKDPQVDVNRYNYREVSLYHKIYNIYNDELTKLKSIFDKLSMPSFEYINRSEIIPSLVGEGIDYPEVVEFEHQDKKQQESYVFPKGIHHNDATIEKMLDHIKAVYAGIKSTKEEVDPIIERNRKRAEIAEKEKSLVSLRDTVHFLFSNKAKDEEFNEYHKRFSTNIITFSQSEFKRYAQKSIEMRIEQIDSLINCYDYLVELYSELKGFEEKIIRIEEDYTRVVWNPFTFTDMEETVKERVYSAFKNKLLPFILESFDEEINCETIRMKVSNFNSLYEKMIELRQKDTRELEKELRKTSDVDKIAALFQLNLELK